MTFLHFFVTAIAWAVFLPGCSKSTNTSPAGGSASLTALASAPPSSTRALTGTTAPADPLDAVTTLLKQGDMAGAKAAFDKALDSSRIMIVDPEGTPPKPPHALSVMGYARLDEAFAVVSEKGDETRFGLSRSPATGTKSTAFVATAAAVTGKVAGCDASDDAPGILGAVVTADARALVWHGAPPCAPRPIGWANPAPMLKTTSVASSLTPSSLTLTRLKPEPVVFGIGKDSGCSFADFSTSPDGTMGYARYGLANDSILRIFSLKTGVELPVLEGRLPVGTIAFSIDHKSTRYAFPVDGVLHIAELNPRRTVEKISLPEHFSDRVGGASVWSPDDSTVAVALTTTTPNLALVDIAAKKVRCTASFEPPLAFSRSGKWLAATDNERRIVLINSADCSVVRVLTEKDSEDVGSQLLFSPSDTRLLSLIGSGVKVFDTATGKVRLTLHIGPHSAAAYTPEGRAELFGDETEAAKLIACGVESYVGTFPFSFCKEKAIKPGLLLTHLTPIP